MKVFAVVFVLFMLTNCTPENRLCECVSAGNEVNELSAAFFDGSNPASRRDSLTQAKEVRDSICKPYINMGTAELQKAAEECSSLKIETNSN
jgi:hypothetical protein